MWLESAFVKDARPEAVEMLIAIANGSQMRPSEGWFHPGQARYGFKWLAGRHAAGLVGMVPRTIFQGTKEQFDRLDRMRDGMLTEEDFDWSERSLLAEINQMLSRVIQAVDASGDRQMSREEWNKFFDAASEGKDHVTLDDLRNGLMKPPQTPSASSSPPRPLTPEILVRGLFRGEIGSIHEGPQLNQLAPDFSLKTRDGKETIRLSDHFGKKPIVLVLGNFTCGPFRGAYAQVDQIAQRYKDDAVFLGVYVREAHPTDGWRMTSNDEDGVEYAQPTSYEQRVTLANICHEKLKMSIPLLVDELDDRVGHAYSGMPSRLYVIDTEGKVAYKSGRGQFGFK
ncbi:MAG: deiodinase family protein, partial [Pirellulaceae bacterium]